MYDFEKEVVQLSSETQLILSKSKLLFKRKREALDVEKCFDLSLFTSKKSRLDLINRLVKYRRQLSLEKIFYLTFQKGVFKKLHTLCGKTGFHERKMLLGTSIIHFLQKHKKILVVNSTKVMAVKDAIELAEFLDDNFLDFFVKDGKIGSNQPHLDSHFNGLIEKIEISLEKQYDLAAA